MDPREELTALRRLAELEAKAGGSVAAPAAPPDPTEGMSTFDKAAAGVGKAMTDIGRGAGQMLGLVSREDVAEARRLDAPLMKTGAGMAGNLAGNVAMMAPAAFIPGVNTMVGATAMGGAMGALQPSVSTGETLTNIGLGGAGGAAGQFVASRAPGWLQSLTGKRQADAAAQAQRLGAAKSAQQAGYVIPPADVKPGNISVELASGLSGKIKTAQQASAKNQTVTNNLARQELGIAADQPLTREALLAIRRDAGNAYQPFKSVGQIAADQDYTKALDGIVAKYQGAARSFPAAAKNDVVEAIDALRVPAFDAGDAIDMTKVLREQSDTYFGQGNKGLASAYKQASDALEAQIERHLQSTGSADMVAAFREARKTIAKTYTVEKALNSGTGDVSAQTLANLLRKGKPLSGGLRTAAEAAEAFPKATQALKESPKTFSPLDFGAAGIAAMSSGGNPLSAAGLLARPAMRSALLSNPAQKAMMLKGPELRALERMLPLFQSGAVNRPLGTSLGLLGADLYE